MPPRHRPPYGRLLVLRALDARAGLGLLPPRLARRRIGLAMRRHRRDRVHPAVGTVARPIALASARSTRHPCRKQHEVVRLDQVPLLKLIQELQAVDPLEVLLVQVLAVDLLHVGHGAPVPASLQVAGPLRGEGGVVVEREQRAAALHQVVDHLLPEPVIGVSLLVNNHCRGRIWCSRGGPLDNPVTMERLHVHQHALRNKECGHVAAEACMAHGGNHLGHHAHVRGDQAVMRGPELARTSDAQLPGNKVLLRARIQHWPEILPLQHRRQLLAQHLWEVDLKVRQVFTPTGWVIT
mmetsp:Transcript_28861/g.89975  ORF Transcript_28861/g.89975 Transcript_28861/m.89975 type:complete len:295 (+) Transcript_28861:69-953(+)